MSSLITEYEATVNLLKVEASEAEAIGGFLQERGRLPEVTGHFMVFRFSDCDNETYLWDEYPPCVEEEPRSLEGILSILNTRHALSLTYLHEWSSSDWEEDREDAPDFEKLAEQLPTLVLQEVLARRLEESD